jgi:hypothetical protein
MLLADIYESSCFALPTSEQLKAEPYPCKFEFECTQEGKFKAESYRSTHGAV